jgi:hypothetical protein
MFLFGMRRFGRMGPLGLLFTAYRLWRRLSPQQKQALRAHGARLGRNMRRRGSDFRSRRTNGPGGIGESGLRDQTAPVADSNR